MRKYDRQVQGITMAWLLLYITDLIHAMTLVMYFLNK